MRAWHQPAALLGVMLCTVEEALLAQELETAEHKPQHAVVGLEPNACRHPLCNRFTAYAVALVVILQALTSLDCGSLRRWQQHMPMDCRVRSQ